MAVSSAHRVVRHVSHPPKTVDYRGERYSRFRAGAEQFATKEAAVARLAFLRERPRHPDKEFILVRYDPPIEESRSVFSTVAASTKRFEIYVKQK